MANTTKYDLPTFREVHALAYDSTRGRLVVFGGRNGTFPYTFYNDTWEFDGYSWYQISTASSPDARGGAAMVFDSSRDKIVLFGGVDDSTFYSDTWEYDGTDWTEVSTGSSPTGRNGPGMVYDSTRNITVLFGGQDNSAVLTDTWEYDGSNWIEITTATSPPGRIVEGIAYDSDRELTVMFGGYNGIGFSVLGDTWEYDGTDWTEIFPLASPPATAGHCMAYDPSIRKSVIFGGFDASFTTTFGTTWTYDGTTWVQYTIDTTTPLKRIYARMAYDPDQDRLLLYGGDGEIDAITFLVLGDLWSFDASTSDPWKELSPLYSDRNLQITTGARVATNAYGWVAEAPTGTPPIRARGASVWDSSRGVVVLFGGESTGGTLLADTWEWNGYNWVQNVTGSAPTARQSHVMVYDSTRERVLLFGGADGGGNTNDTWVYDGSDWTELLPAAQPPVRNAAAAGYDPDRDVVILFGGDGASVLADTWEYDGTNWASISPSTSPPARHLSTFAYDLRRKKLVVFGGLNTGGADLSDTWEYDGNDWVQVTTSTTPGDRSNATGTYSPTSKTLVMFGGTDDSLSTQYDDTWEYDGANWTDITVATRKPTARDSHTIAYDGVRDALVLHSGGVFQGVGSFNETHTHPSAQYQKLIGPEYTATGPLATFTATLVASSPDSVTFTLIINGVHRWWDGSRWTKSDGSLSKSNEFSDINSNLGSLDLSSGDTFQLNAVFYSDTGLTQPSLTDVTFSFTTPSGGETTTVSISENPLGHSIVEMSVGSLVIDGEVVNITVTLKSIGALLPNSVEFVEDNNLIPEIISRAGISEDSVFETLSETSTGTQGDYTITVMELTP